MRTSPGRLQSAYRAHRIASENHSMPAARKGSKLPRKIGGSEPESRAQNGPSNALWDPW